MDEFLDGIMRRVNQPPGGFQSSYDAGFDCGKNGSNEKNCDYRWFKTPGNNAEWERGKRDAQQQTESQK